MCLSQGPQRSDAGDQAFELKSCLICFKSFVLMSANEMLVKMLTTDLVIAKLKPLTFDPAEGVIGVG